MPQTFNLRDMPDDVMDIILDKQTELKKKFRGRLVSREEAVKKLIRYAKQCEDAERAKENNKS